MSRFVVKAQSVLENVVAHGVCAALYPVAILAYTRLSGKGQYEFSDEWRVVGDGIALISGESTSGANGPLSDLKKTFATLVIQRGSELCIINPCALSPALKRRLQDAGEVTSIVLPNFFHNVCIGDYVEEFPDATIYLPEKLANEKLPDLTGITYLADGHALLHGDIEVVHLEGYSELAEYHFYHQKSKTLFMCDILHGPGANTTLERLLRRFYYKKSAALRFPRYHRWYMDDVSAMLRYIRRLQHLDVRQLVVPHGGPLLRVSTDELIEALLMLLQHRFLDRAIRYFFWNSVNGYRMVMGGSDRRFPCPDVSPTKKLWDALYVAEFSLGLNRRGRRRVLWDWEDRLARRLARELREPDGNGDDRVHELDGSSASPARVQSCIKLYRPFRIRGIDIPAHRDGGWTLSNFKDRFGHLHADVKKDASSCMVHEGELQRMTLTDHLDSFDKDGYQHYAAHLGNIFHRAPELLEYAGVPNLEHLAGHRFHKVELFVGPKGTGTTMHMAGGCSMFIQMVGYKQWTLVDPQYSPLMSATSAGHEFFSAIDHTDPRRTYTGPPAKDHAGVIPYRRILLAPGDVLFVPSYWWHAVDNLTHTIGCVVRLPFSQVFAMPFCVCDMQRPHWWSGPANFFTNRRGASDREDDVFKHSYLIGTRGSRVRANPRQAIDAAG